MLQRLRPLRTPLRSSLLRPAAKTTFHTLPAQRNNNNNNTNNKPSSDPAPSSAGAYARTDDSIKVTYPSASDLPASTPVSGAGQTGTNTLPTLATFSLQGRVSLVTGGARGLGLVMGQGLVISGSDLAIVDLNLDEARRQAEGIVETFRRDYPHATKVPRVTAHYADVSDEKSVEACIREVIEEHGRIDHLVTSAGFTENFEAVKYPIERMRKLWAVNVDGTYLFATGVARHLMERKAQGSMVFIGSMSGSIVNVPQPQA